MAEIEIRLPKMGESVTEATITNWLKNVGDSVAMDEPLVEVATDKVDNELPSEGAGTLVKILFEKDQVAQVGDVIAILSTDGSASAAAPSASIETAAPVAAAPVAAAPVANSADQTAIPKSGANGKFYSPLVRKIADKEGISANELDAISGTGQDGRVTKKDMFAYLENRGTAPVTAAPSATAAAASPAATPSGASFMNIKEPIVLPNPGDEIMEMDRMRKLIADHMVMSVHVSPHVTSYVEADVTNIVKWREKVKNTFKQREGQNITYTPILIEAYR